MSIFDNDGTTMNHIIHPNESRLLRMRGGLIEIAVDEVRRLPEGSISNQEILDKEEFRANSYILAADLVELHDLQDIDLSVWDSARKFVERMLETEI